MIVLGALRANVVDDESRMSEVQNNKESISLNSWAQGHYPVQLQLYPSK